MEKTIEISFDEAKGLKDFVDAVKEIDIVECVYLLPYFSLDRQEEKISVVAIRNSDAIFDSKGDFEVYSKRVKEQFERLGMVIDGFAKEFNHGRVVFTQDNYDDYSIALMRQREIATEMKLVGGTILFDRNGKLTKNKESASQYLNTFPNVLSIVNPDVLKANGFGLN